MKARRSLSATAAPVLCAGTQEKLHHTLETHFKPDEIGHICCLGRCHEGAALQYQGKNYSGSER
jgi:hypothetical protein